MIGELIFFFIIGTLIVGHQLECARDEGIASVYVQMPLKALRDIGI